MRAILLVPDGVGVRNFVLGRFLRRLSGQAEVHVFHVIPPALLPRLAPPHLESVRWHEMIPYRPGAAAMTLQYALGYAQMFWADTQSMRRLRAQTVASMFRMKLFLHGARMLGRTAAGPRRMKLLDRLHCSAASRLPEVDHYREAFRAIRPDVLFCTHQRPSVVLPAVLAARSLGIPTASFIFSWDNITSKGRIVAPFDHYLVWSAHMRDELIRYYPDIDASRIHIVGTPQFEPYADASLLWSREEFCRRIGADPDRPLICYSGGDAGTCPEDPDHAAVLLRLVREGSIGGRPQVLVRPVPVDEGSRYRQVRETFPELIYAQPEWVHSEPGNWARVFPTAEDVRFLANLTRHADVNVNLGSTMTLDFGLRDKPVVNVAFDVADPPVFGMPVWDYYYHFEHYRPVVELKAARFARAPAELAAHVDAYLRNPALDREGRLALTRLEVGVPAAESSDYAIAALSRIAGSPARDQIKCRSSAAAPPETASRSRIPTGQCPPSAG